MMDIKKVKIKDIMDSPPTNSGLKKKDVLNIKKSDHYLPVYSASQDEDSIFGWVIDDDDWRSYSNVLTWNKDGSAGKVFYRKDKFIPYEKVKILEIKPEFKNSLYYPYLKFDIENKLMSLGFGFNYKCSMERVLEVEIEIPINKSSEFDISKQKDLAEKYIKIDALKKNIEKLYQDILNIKVTLNEEYDGKIVEVSNIFKIHKGSSKYTKAYIRNHKGEYPLYSSQTKDEGVIGYIDSFDYDIECLTWTTDGIYAGTVFYRNEKFSMTTHCGALIPKADQLSNIDLEFVFFQLKKILKDYATGEGNKRVTAEIIENVSINIPYDENNNFDLIKQKSIVSKLKTIEAIKNGLKKKFQEIVSYNLDILR